MGNNDLRAEIPNHKIPFTASLAVATPSKLKIPNDKCKTKQFVRDCKLQKQLIIQDIGMNANLFLLNTLSVICCMPSNERSMRLSDID